MALPSPPLPSFLYLSQSLQDAMEIVEKPGIEALKMLVGRKPFDLVFIDADKENQINYYEFILNNGLLSENGCICVDNTLWYSKVLTHKDHQDSTTAHIDLFNKHVTNDPRTHNVIVPVRDGLTIITRAKRE
jgi:caffeoyl-CoA O-methyltransferase